MLMEIINFAIPFLIGAAACGISTKLYRNAVMRKYAEVFEGQFLYEISTEDGVTTTFVGRMSPSLTDEVNAVYEDVEGKLHIFPHSAVQSVSVEYCG